VVGNRADARAAFSALTEALGQLAEGFPEAVPLLAGEETSCVAQLDFDWTSLLNPALVEQVAEWSKALTTEDVEMKIRGLSVRFTIRTQPSDFLGEYGINLWDRTLTVEPRVDTPLSQRTFFTYSPCDSDTHLKNLLQLEARLSKKASRAARK
jgi:hypothetical protein